MNPDAGRERRPGFGPIGLSSAPGKVAVIGGGPAGLETARIAAARGHAVTLYEASSSLGGQFLLASTLPRRDQLRTVIDHLVRELRLASVTIETDARIVALDELPGEPDTVLVATGAAANPLPAGEAEAGVLSWWDVIASGVPAPSGEGRAVFADDGTGFWFSYGVAELLAVAGWRVTFVTTSPAVAAGIPHESVEPLLVRLGRAGTAFKVLTAVQVVERHDIVLTDVLSGEDTAMRADLVVRQTGRRPVVLPASDGELQGRVRRLGDCLTPRRIGHAMLEAHTLARPLL